MDGHKPASSRCRRRRLRVAARMAAQYLQSATSSRTVVPMAGKMFLGSRESRSSGDCGLDAANARKPFASALNLSNPKEKSDGSMEERKESAQKGRGGGVAGMMKGASRGDKLTRGGGRSSSLESEREDCDRSDDDDDELLEVWELMLPRR